MKYTAKRVLAFLLMIVMLWSMVACVEKNVPSPLPESLPTTDPTGITSTNNTNNANASNASGTQTPSVSTFIPTDDFVVVYAETAKGTALIDEALDYLNTAMQTVYGHTLAVTDDGTASTKNSYEILVGDTNREESKKAIADLGVRDFSYKVESKNLIVICGGSLSATRQAVVKFCSDILGYKQNKPITEQQKPISIGDDYLQRATYPYQSVTLNHDSLDHWTIVMDGAEGAATYADDLVTMLGYYTGERVKTVMADNMTGEEQNLIVLGGIGRNISTASTYYGDYCRLEGDSRGMVLSLYSSEEGALYHLVAYLKQSLEVLKNGKSVTLLLSQTYHLREIPSHVPVWILQSETRTELYDGVTYVEQIFEGTDGKPYHTYALIIDPDKVTLHMGSSNDGYDYTVAASNRQTTLQHMQAAVANGENIIAGVNTNVFRMSGNYSPRGLALKDGILINESEADYAFLAITEDGTIIIDDGGDYDTYVKNGTKFVEGVAGWSILMEDGLMREETVEPGQGEHPRTLGGLTEDGMLILGVIDGRQATISNGAGYVRSACWMRSLGAETVINFDGGGSSGFVLRNAETNAYEICNSPSDGQLRKVYNSLLVELK